MEDRVSATPQRVGNVVDVGTHRSAYLNLPRVDVSMTLQRTYEDRRPWILSPVGTIVRKSPPGQRLAHGILMLDRVDAQSRQCALGVPRAGDRTPVEIHEGVVAERIA
jgi:hypothetical protein